ncbi:unnamed protein product [Sphagnum compactum]
MGLRKGNLRTHFKRRSQFEPLASTLMDGPLLHNVPNHSEMESLVVETAAGDVKLCILKLDGSCFEVTVPRNARVRDLKQAVMKYVDLSQQNKIGDGHISWKHVWGSFCLCYEDAKLIEDSAYLQSLGIKNNEQLRFEHHVSSREVRCHSPAQKRRFYHGLWKI